MLPLTNTVATGSLLLTLLPEVPIELYYSHMLQFHNTATTGLLLALGLLLSLYQKILFSSWILLLQCRQKHKFPAKHWCISIKLQNITSKEKIIFCRRYSNLLSVAKTGYVAVTQ
jgi:hypothetical protein